MRFDYTDAAQACAEIAGFIRRDFPADTLEITYHVRGQPHAQHHLSNGRDLEDILIRHTAAFPGARALYTPHHPYGLICLIECWCAHHELAEQPLECRCDAIHNRSSIVIVVVEHNHLPVRIGNKKPPKGTRSSAEPRHPWRAEEIDPH